MEATEKFELEQAKKLLQNIERYSDVRNIKVLKADSFSMEETTLKDWFTWLYKRIELYGEFGVEKQFLNVITRIDTHVVTMSERAKEGFRRLLLVVEKQNLDIVNLNLQVKGFQKELEETKEKYKKISEEKIEESEEVVVEVPEVKKIVVEEKEKEPEKVEDDEDDLEDYEN